MAAPQRSVLVSYSSSSDEESNQDLVSNCSEKRHLSQQSPCYSNQLAIKKKCVEKEADRLPVPSSVVHMFDSMGKNVLDEPGPGRHGGRVRSFQHERGNWASYVYATVKADERLSELTDSLIKCLRLHGTFTASDDVHLSFSRTFVIRHHWIQPLLQSLSTNLKHCPGCDCAFLDIKIYTNDERTRTFVGLRIHDVSSDCLRDYVRQIDSSLQEFKLPVYYKEPSFHVSVAWAVGDLTQEITMETKEKLQEELEEFLEECPDLSVFSIKRLEFKTGNQVHPIELGTHR